MRRLVVASTTPVLLTIISRIGLKGKLRRMPTVNRFTCFQTRIDYIERREEV